MILQFNVINQKIVRTDDNYIVANSQYYLQMDFQFTRDWDDAIKIITFRNGQDNPSIELKDDSCVVPWEVIKVPAFTFSIVGKKDATIITTDVVKVIVKPSGERDGCDPKPPSKQIWEGLLGGEENQLLIKKSDEDFDYVWIDLADIPYGDSGKTIGEIIENKERAYVEENGDVEDCYTLCFTKE